MFFQKLLQGRQVIAQGQALHLLNALFREGQPARELLQLLLLQFHQSIMQPGQGDRTLFPPACSLARVPTPSTREVGAGKHTLAYLTIQVAESPSVWQQRGKALILFITGVH